MQSKTALEEKSYVWGLGYCSFNLVDFDFGRNLWTNLENCFAICLVGPQSKTWMNPGQENSTNSLPSIIFSRTKSVCPKYWPPSFSETSRQSENWPEIVKIVLVPAWCRSILVGCLWPFFFVLPFKGITWNWWASWTNSSVEQNSSKWTPRLRKTVLWWI